MTQHDQAAPATKQDIGMLMESMGKLYVATERWKDELVGTMEEKMEIKKEESLQTMKRYFDVAVENIHQEMLHAHREEIEVLRDRSEDHGKRIQKLESVVGLSV